MTVRPDNRKALRHDIVKYLDYLYVVEGSVIRPRFTVLLAPGHNKNWNIWIKLWHKILGHVKKDVIATLSKWHAKRADLSIKVDVVSRDLCTEAKQTELACNGLVVTESKEHVVYFEIIGPVGLGSWGRSCYILIMAARCHDLKTCHLLSPAQGFRSTFLSIGYGWGAFVTL